MQQLTSLLGLASLILVTFLLSNNKSKVNWRLVISGILLQISLGFFILKTKIGIIIFSQAKLFFTSVLAYSTQGAVFIFGPLAQTEHLGFLFFTMVLPTIIFMSALMNVLYHLGIMQIIIQLTAKAMIKIMGTSGAESLSAAANIFAGQTEAPLVVRPYISSMTHSEIMALMTGGMATVAGGVLAAFVGLGIDAGHLLAASVMSAPAALVCAKILVPETKQSNTSGEVKLTFPNKHANIIDAAAAGATDGLKLALNVAAMLLAFIALIALLNGGLAQVGQLIGLKQLSMEWVCGYLFAPVAWLIGVPTVDIISVGALLGKKLVLNEFVAYLDLKEISSTLTPRAVVISTYALCGFANFGSIAIQIGGIGTIAPQRRSEISQLGIKSLIGGTIACLMTACIAGIMI